MSSYDNFIQGILEKKIVVIKYLSQKEKKIISRKCAPIDFGPKRKPNGNCNDYIDNGANKYLFFDFDGSNGGHIAGKNIDEVISIELLNENFTPNEVVDFNKIKCPWHIKREW